MCDSKHLPPLVERVPGSVLGRLVRQHQCSLGRGCASYRQVGRPDEQFVEANRELRAGG